VRDLRSLTVEELRALARKRLGPGSSRLRTKDALVAALEEAAGTVKRTAQKVRKRGAKPTSTSGEKGPRRRGAAAPVARPPEEGELDPAAFFVARVRGEDAVRDAPHPMAEAAEGAPAPAPADDGGGAPAQPEALGDLPSSYGEDTLVLLPRDPRTLFVYWDHAEATLRDGLRGVQAPRVELWVYARAGDGWERVRRIEVALESRGYYVHGVDAGRTYRAELRVVDRAGGERLLGPGSGEAGLPRGAPSPIVDDRFVLVPWDQPLGPPLGPGHPGGEFPPDAREALARLSGWPGEAGAGRDALRPWSPDGTPRGPGEGER
jgi:hypothetical protein